MTQFFLAVDIGNARMKIGVFDTFIGDALPEPIRTLPLNGERRNLIPLDLGWRFGG